MQPEPKPAMQLVTEAKQRIENLTPDQLAAELENGGVLPVDLREADERIQRGSIRGSVHAACSALAVETLQQLGYTDVAHLESGLTAWTSAGREVNLA
jgi:rhodanese-related sulfurtransferase